MGNNFLNDIEATIWSMEDRNDFVTLFPRMLQKDFFTSMLGGLLLDLYHRIWGHRRKVGNRNPCTNQLSLFHDHE